MRLNKWVRRLWLVNGIIVLIGGGIFTFQLIQSYYRIRPEERGPMVGERLEKAASDSLALQDISLTLPRSIGITPYRFIQVTAKDLTTPVRIMKYSELRVPPSEMKVPDYSYENNVLGESGTINLLFLKADGSEPRLLLDKKGFILSADIPNERDSIQKVNVYRLVFYDTDGDGRLTRLDRSDLYCSDLNGLNLRQVTNDSIRIVRYTKSLRPNKLYIQAKIRPTGAKIPEADWSERIYVYDVKSSQLAPFVAEEGVLKKVREMLWSK
jgi:hypothetical protein